jgi:hypothetical protein
VGVVVAVVMMPVLIPHLLVGSESELPAVVTEAATRHSRRRHVTHLEKLAANDTQQHGAGGRRRQYE